MSFMISTTGMAVRSSNVMSDSKQLLVIDTKNFIHRNTCKSNYISVDTIISLRVILMLRFEAMKSTESLMWCTLLQQSELRICLAMWYVTDLMAGTIG